MTTRSGFRLRDFIRGCGRADGSFASCSLSGNVWLVYWGFVEYFKPGADYAKIPKAHHECGRFDSGSRPVLVRFCMNQSIKK